MKVELHLHTNRFSGCAKHTPDELMVRLIQAGYQVVYLTEHDRVWPSDALADLQASFTRYGLSAPLARATDIPIYADLLIGATLAGVENLISQRGNRDSVLTALTDSTYATLTLVVARKANQ